MTENDQNRVEGKVCLVTGATSGIGKATAIGLAKQGATVVIVARNQARGEASLQEIRAITRFILSRLGSSPEKGARTSLFLATSRDVEGITGKYFANCQPTQSSLRSYDETLQRHLWEESARLVHLPW